MKTLKRLITVMTVAAMLGSGSFAIAEERCEEGVAYYDSYGTSCVTPAIGLGVIAIAAIIAVAINNSNRGHTHQH